uniref:BPTI/Kunitz inhibitor domain-containing protein n=1 Tax=Romanomermis culicivorax TaxID=13658 RepID=A0A915HE94_ROMCU
MLAHLILIDAQSLPATICNLPPSPGPCRGHMERFYYNPNERQCSKFIYGGCPGNGNMFETKEKCEKACKK